MTNVLALRIDKYIRKELEIESNAKNISINALASSILKKYVEWDRFVIKYGFISIPNNAFNKILYNIDEKYIIELADLTSRELQQIITFSSIKPSTNNVIKALNYWFESPNIQSRYLDEILLVKHEYGIKGTLYLKTLISNLLESDKTKIIEVLH